MKRIISVILTIAMVLGISMETFAAYGGEKSRAYQKDNCTITYSITNEWSGNQQITISITNDGEETLRNWAIMFDNSGRIANICNADVCKNDGKLCVIRNNGYNYEIIPNATVEFGFMLQGEDLSLPEDISLCSRTADSTESAEISYEIQNNWGDGFIAAVTVKNTSEKPLEAWKLSFNACTWLDSDNDGLPDYAEKIYGTDPKNADTDGDGLSDYDEIYKTGTNPLKYDTDEDGVNDADSDNDKDGLTNSEELELGTDPNSADTDGDGLSDYDEINKHNTDPLKTDSDGDTLNDGDEIILGLDPNDPETFGVPDAEYKVKQTISADSEVMERVNTEDSPYELSLEITASGNAQNLIAGSSAYSAITESDARLGGAVSLDYYGGDVEKVKLTYEIGESYISNEGSKYAENCVDMQGIKRYNIFRYFEELNMLLPVATEFDEENNTLFAETDELGTYCVLDMEVLLQTFGVNPDGSQTEQVERQMYAGVNDGYNICFIIDIRKDVITDEQLENIKNEIIAFMSNAEDNNKRIGITICVQANSDLGEDSQSCEYVGYYTSSEELRIALDEINLVNYVGTEDKADVDFNCLVVSDGVKMMSYQSRGTNNYIFDIYSISYSFFNRSGFAENEQAIIEKCHINWCQYKLYFK